MTLRPERIVKICGVTNSGDACAAVDAGATAIGFNFFPSSPRYVTPEAAARIAPKIHGALKAGVFVNEDPARVREVCREAGMDVAQLHGGAAPDGVAYWRACRVPQGGEFVWPDAEDAEAILLDTASETLAGGTGMTFPWSVAREAGERRVIVAGGLSGDNVRQAIREARPWGVDACSRIEAAPGRKDHRKMKEFIEAALAEFRSC